MKPWLLVVTLCVVAYFLWSFSLTDPNLVLSSWPPYWSWQVWWWQIWLSHRNILTLSFVIIVSSWWWASWQLSQVLSTSTSNILKIPRPMPKSWWWGAGLIGLLVLSYNALSHDLFNYLFNAKMVLVYHADPHAQVALNFPHDLWLRFMHNTHTPAPYGYGWTLWSLLPSLAGLGVFSISWLLFKIWGLLSWLALADLYWHYHQATAQSNKKTFNWQLALAVLLNPLVLIEFISNAHNDLWMMVPAVWSFCLVTQTKITPKQIALAAAALCISISIKYATVTLIPLWILLVLTHRHSAIPLAWTKALRSSWPLLASFCLGVLLLTSRSQFFHPWYLSWLLVWLPFVRERWWHQVVLVLSFSSLIRYVPWLLTGEYNSELLLQSQLITWLPVVALAGKMSIQKIITEARAR